MMTLRLLLMCAVLCLGCRSQRGPERVEKATDHHSAAARDVNGDALAAGVSAPSTRARAVEKFTYDSGERIVPNAPGHRARARATVVWPADLGVSESPPLALIVHGNHGTCTDPDGEQRCSIDDAVNDRCPSGAKPFDNSAGMLWVARALASRGWVAVSIDANTVNCSGLPSLIQGRSRLVIEHLRLWNFWKKNGLRAVGSLPVERVDLSRVAIIGHSNGAEAAARVTEVMEQRRWDPELRGVRVKAVVMIASSDSTESRVVNATLLHVSAGCDGQLPEHDGVRILDRTLEHRDAWVIQTLMPRVSHNVFNDLWGKRESDDPRWTMCPGAKLTPGADARQAMTVMMVAFLEASLRGGQAMPRWLCGDVAPPTTVPTSVSPLITCYPPNYITIERFNDLRKRGTNFRGGAVQASEIHGGLCFGDACSQSSPNVASAILMNWTAPGAHLSLTFPHLDLSDHATLSVRLTRGQGVTPERLPVSLVLIDRAGQSASVSLSESARHVAWPRLSKGNERITVRPDVLSAVRVPLKKFLSANPHIDLRHVASLRIEGHQGPSNGQYSVIVSDLEATSP